jgi:hypothetical protein
MCHFGRRPAYKWLIKRIEHMPIRKVFHYATKWECTPSLLVLHWSTIVTAGQYGQPAFSANAAQIPDHFITYQDDPGPEWKKIWDQARRLYARKKYGQAQVQYELLLASKDNVDQARWEYVTILMCRRQWQKADAELARRRSQVQQARWLQHQRSEIGDFPADSQGSMPMPCRHAAPGDYQAEVAG